MIFEKSITLKNEMIKKYQGNLARKLVKKTFTRDNIIIDGWRNDRIVECWFIQDGTKIISIALMSKMDYDPHEITKDPWMINYLFTFEKYRKQGFASKLVKHIQEKRQELVIFPYEEKLDFYTKLGFSRLQNDSENYVMYYKKDL